MTLTRSILAIALVAIAQHALVHDVRAQAASAPDLEAILATPKIVKTLDDIKADDARTLPSRSASPKFRRRHSRRNSAPSIIGSGCRNSASRMLRLTAKAT